MKFFYVYVLYGFKDKEYYVGFTENLKKRYAEHKQGKVTSTFPRLPLEPIFYEAYKNKYDALRREKYLKSSKGKTTLKSMLREFLKNIPLKAYSL